MVALVFADPAQEQSVTQGQDVIVIVTLITIYTTLENFENQGFTLKTPEKFETQQSPVILDLCLKKIRKGKSYYYRDVSIYEKLRLKEKFFVPVKMQSRHFQIPPFVKHHFCDKLVWKEGITE